MLKIGIDATPMLSAQKTGIERYASELILALNKELALSSDLKLYLYFHLGNSFIEKDAIENYLPFLESIHYRFYQPRRGYGYFLPLAARKDRLQIFHFLRFNTPKIKPCRSLLTVHHTLTNLPDEGRQIEGGRQSQQERATSLADGFIAVSRTTARDLSEAYSISPDLIWVVYHGIGHYASTNADCIERVRQKLDIDEYILYVGTLQYRKNLVRLVQAYARLKERYEIPYQLVLAGRKGHGCAAIFDEVAKLGIEREVVFPGYVADEDIEGLYRGAELFAYPSIHEGFGIPVLEAMAFGTVVATSNASCIPEVGGDAAIYFDPYDVEEMAAAIYSGLSDVALRDELQRRGLARANLFSWQRAARETIAVYRNFAARYKLMKVPL